MASACSPCLEGLACQSVMIMSEGKGVQLVVTSEVVQGSDLPLAETASGYADDVVVVQRVGVTSQLCLGRTRQQLWGRRLRDFHGEAALL